MNHQSAKFQLVAALRAIPPHEKVEYLHALRVAPQLVHSESDPVAFLRFCEWNATAAARRLVVYWRTRREVFGETRAFLPLLGDLSGNGALGVEEIEFLRLGGYCLMPFSSGHPVVHMDRQRFPLKYQERTDVKLRAGFYILQQLSFGCVRPEPCVAVIRSYLSAFGNSAQRKGAEIAREAFPLRVRAIHLVFLRERAGLMHTIMPFQKVLENFGRFFTDKAIVHTVESVEQVVSNLAKHGIGRESLPPSLGGFAGTDGTASYSQLSSSSCDGSIPGPLAAVAPAVNNRNPTRLEVELDSRNSGDLGSDDLQLDASPMKSPPGRQDQPHKQSAATCSGKQNDGHAVAPPLATENSLFDKLLDLTASDLAGSPFDPRPIRQQRIAMHPSVEASPINESVRLLDSSSSVEVSSTLQRSLTPLSEALTRIPGPEKAAFLEAVRRAPALVQRESDPTKYLRFESSNAGIAARRLALCWKYRVQFFGERAFLPLTQTMDGALWEEDLRTLASGYFSFLPADLRGRPVLCIDPSKRPVDASKASRIRVALYFFSILCCEHPAVMTEGCVIFIFVSALFKESIDHDARMAVDVALDSFPIKKWETHVIYSPPSSTASPLKSLMALVLPVLLRAMGRLLVSDHIHFHVGVTRDELQRNLAQCGQSGAVLQAAVNGGTSDHEFAQWMKNRQLLELRRCGHRRRRRQEEKNEQQSPDGIAVQERTSAGSIGPNNSPPQARGSCSSVEPQYISAAMELVSATEKGAYLEAIEKAPNLVREESDPAQFLKVENYNTLEAARRLAAYWRIRREVFSERFILPMNQTGDGALDRRDVAVLQTGFLTQLPNDATGRSVICCDGSRLGKASPSALLRIFFYLWSVISQNDLQRTNGYIMLYVMAGPSFDRACKVCLDLAMEAHPVSLTSFHLLGCCSDGISESDFRLGSVREALKLFDRSIQDKVVVHVCGWRGVFASKLVGHGLSKQGLPVSFGGKWGLEDFVQWQELRVRHEWNLHIGVTARDVAESYSIPTPTVPPPSSLNDDEKTERQRRMNVVHSRRMRVRSRIEMEVLQEQCITLREDQKELLRQGRELEQLLERAEACQLLATNTAKTGHSS